MKPWLLVSALFLALVAPLMAPPVTVNDATSLLAPEINLPLRIDFGGTASHTIPIDTCRSFGIAPESSEAQLRVTVAGSNFDFVTGMGWQLHTPNGARFQTQVIVTALAGSFTISKIQ